MSVRREAAKLLGGVGVGLRVHREGAEGGLLLRHPREALGGRRQRLMQRLHLEPARALVRVQHLRPRALHHAVDVLSDFAATGFDSKASSVWNLSLVWNKTSQQHCFQ